MDPERDLNFPSGEWVDRLVAQALAEDLGKGDATTAVSVAEETLATGSVVSRDAGVVAGLPLLALVFGQLDPRVRVDLVLEDGAPVEPGSVAARLTGPAGSILSGERVALNFLQHLGGIASLTARYVVEVAGTACRVLDTRKTLPGYRTLAKYAVRCGGGHNHREDLSSAVLIKDNHIAAAGGLTQAVRRAREYAPHTCRVECEVDSQEHLEEAMAAGVDIVMLDNFSDAQVQDAVAFIDARAIIEVSGGITLERIPVLAELGADVISVGALTHSSPSCDLGLDWS